MRQTFLPTRIAALCLVAALSSVSSAQFVKITKRSYDIDKVHPLRAETDRLVSLGRFREAKNLILEKTLPLTAAYRAAIGEYDDLVKISFELGDAEDVRRYFFILQEKLAVEGWAEPILAPWKMKALILLSCGSTEPVSYQEFKQEFPTVSVRRELISDFGTAAASYHFKRARFVFAEMERCGVPESELKRQWEYYERMLERQRVILEFVATARENTHLKSFDLKKVRPLRDKANKLVALGRLREAKSYILENILPLTGARIDYEALLGISFELDEAADVRRYFSYAQDQLTLEPLDEDTLAKWKMKKLIAFSCGSTQLISNGEYEKEYSSGSVTRGLIDNVQIAVDSYHFKRARFLIAEMEDLEFPSST